MIRRWTTVVVPLLALCLATLLGPAAGAQEAPAAIPVRAPGVDGPIRVTGVYDLVLTQVGVYGPADKFVVAPAVYDAVADVTVDRRAYADINGGSGVYVRGTITLTSGPAAGRVYTLNRFSKVSFVGWKPDSTRSQGFTLEGSDGQGHVISLAAYPVVRDNRIAGFRNSGFLLGDTGSLTTYFGGLFGLNGGFTGTPRD